MSAEPEILTGDEADMFEQVGKPAAQVVAKAGQSMVARQEQANVPAARQDDAAMVSMIERIVMDPTIPIDRLEQMLAMKERMEDRAREDEERRAKKLYFAAMSKCQAELPVVIKTKKNSHTNSTYADLAAIENQAMPVIHKYGFAVSFQPDGYNDKGELRVLWEISHEDGHSRNGVGEIPVDGAGSQGKVNKTGTQAFGSTATYGRRYLLCMLFNISTGDDKDGNRVESFDPINEEQVKIIRDLIEEGGVDIAIFCEKWKIDAVPDLPVNQFEPARKSLVSWIASQKTQRKAS